MLDISKGVAANSIGTSPLYRFGYLLVHKADGSVCWVFARVMERKNF